jgi:hypothetical protein
VDCVCLRIRKSGHGTKGFVFAQQSLDRIRHEDSDPIPSLGAFPRSGLGKEPNLEDTHNTDKEGKVEHEHEDEGRTGDAVDRSIGRSAANLKQGRGRGTIQVLVLYHGTMGGRKGSCSSVDGPRVSRRGWDEGLSMEPGA